MAEPSAQQRPTARRVTTGSIEALPASRPAKRDVDPRMARRHWYAIVGVAVSLGAPLGFFVLHLLTEQTGPLAQWVGHELRSRAADYIYLTLASAMAFALFGRLLGRREDHVRRMSVTDPLTGLHNRRYFFERFNEEVAQASRNGHALSLLVVDVDGLKAINDLDGHSAGDEAIQLVATCVARVCRAGDVPARFGGDEFVVLLPGTPASRAMPLANRIRHALGDGNDARTRPPTVSIGVAEWQPADPVTPAILFARADSALYKAKDLGRNRAELFEPGDISEAA